MLTSTPLRKRLLAAAALSVLAVSTAGCGIEKTEKTEKADEAPESVSTPAASNVPSAAPASPAPIEWDGTCEYVAGAGEPATKVDLPDEKPDLVDSYTVTMVTSIGDLELELYPAAAPCTVNSFVSLIEQGYYDDTTCHRVIDGFMAQCGDPTATGTGGPGYSFDDELSGAEQYVPGAVAMANSGPATNGSQFFVVTGEATHLTTHTIFGGATPETTGRLREAAASQTPIEIEKVTVAS